MMNDDEKYNRLLELMTELTHVAEYSEALRKMSNHELSRLVMYRIWADIPMTDERSVILEEVIDRLKRSQ